MVVPCFPIFSLKSLKMTLRSESAHNANDTVRDISGNSLTSMPILPLDVPFQVVIASVRAKKSRWWQSKRNRKMKENRQSN